MHYLDTSEALRHQLETYWCLSNKTHLILSTLIKSLLPKTDRLTSLSPNLSPWPHIYQSVKYLASRLKSSPLPGTALERMTRLPAMLASTSPSSSRRTTELVRIARLVSCVPGRDWLFLISPVLKVLLIPYCFSCAFLLKQRSQLKIYDLLIFWSLEGVIVKRTLIWRTFRT